MRLLAALLALTLAAIAQNAREPMDQGIQDYKSARYAEAATAFQKAVDLNPSDVTARLYLGTTLMSQYVPGAQSPENSEFARRAEAEFQEVLRLEPTDETALASLAALNYQEAQGMTDSTQKSAKLDESSSWYLRLIAADPRDKEAYYSLGVIGWMKWYPAWIQACVTLGMRPSDPGPLPPSAVKAELKNQYSSVIEHAISSLQKALEIDPQYDDAMAYMNLLIRERADLRDTPEDYRRDIEQADQWVQKALDTKRLKAQAALPQRIRVIGNVQQANLIRKVDPVYPQAAREAAIPR